MTRPAGLVDGLLADRYRLTERLAVGGMGEVWRAVDTLLDRPVAVKALRAEYVDDEDFRARFRAEARHAARLSHPGIASVYDFGELSDSAWLVMELVDGEPLSALLRRTPRLPVDRALDVLAQTASALHAAHTGGVVHRDVKPGNLMVRPDGAVKVTDFGIASVADAVPLTRTGEVVGTAFYLSPEQALGRSGTPATDVYALGVVAYECLAGARPFPGENPVSVAMAHVQAAPPPLPDDVPAEVQALVLQMLAKDPAERPGSAAEVAAAARGLRQRLAAPPVPQASRVLPADTDHAPDDAPADPPADATRVLPVVAGRGSRRSGRRAAPRGGLASRDGQRWAVRAVLVLLGLLALLLGLRPLGTDPVVVPALATGAGGLTAAQAEQALKEVGLQADITQEASRTVPDGRLIAVRPGPGSEVEEGSAVQLLVSSGPAPVTVTVASLRGRPAAEVRDLLRGQGLVPRLAYDGSGTPVGTVSGVEPVGALEVGTPVVLHVVPQPPAPAPAPATGGDADRGGSKGKGGGKGKGRG